MTRLVLTPRARADIDDIWEFTAANWGVDQAEKYVTRLRDACAALADGRAAGRDLGNVMPGYRKQDCGAHMIIFRMAGGDSVHVVRILHSRMDIGRHLSAVDGVRSPSSPLVRPALSPEPRRRGNRALLVGRPS